MAIGGVQRGLLATLARADHERFEYHVLCTKKEGHWAGDVRALGVPLHCRKTLPPWNPFQIWRLSRSIRAIAPDLVHIHMAPLVIPAASAAILAGVRHVVIQHHSDYTRLWTEQHNALLRFWERRLTRRADAIVAVSHAAAIANALALGFAADQVSVIPNGIELERFREAVPHDPRPEWGLAADRPLAVQVSRYLDSKRIEDFIGAAAHLLRDWPAASSRPAFAVIGGGADDYRRRYEALIQSHRLRGDVILAGSRNDVPALLKAAQVGVLASENEGFGQVVLEYAAAGLPVAAVELPSLKVMLAPERQALYSPPRRPDRLADNIRRLLLDPDFARQLVAQALPALDQFDWNHAVRAYESLYSSLLEPPSSPV
jgi:glycosyltransferase involved in cell wall biosynthesis